LEAVAEGKRMILEWAASHQMCADSDSMCAEIREMHAIKAHNLRAAIAHIDAQASELARVREFVSSFSISLIQPRDNSVALIPKEGQTLSGIKTKLDALFPPTGAPDV